jgi:hypothetical protein
VTVKRRLTRIRLDKIAAVDKPCQAHATMAIIKRAPAGPADMFKQTFQQALGNTLLNDQVREAFYGAFDNMYEGKDAFRTALIDEFTAGGDGAVASDAYKAWLTGLVDRAVTTVRAAGAAQIVPEALAKAFTDAADEWLVSQQEYVPMTITTKAALLAAVAKFDPSKSSVAELTEIKKAATDLNLEAELPVEGPLAIAKADPELAILKRRVDVAEMSAPIRKHFDGLDAAGQTAFLAKDAAGRQADIDAIEKGDPILYTTTAGLVIRKSDGAVAAELAKSNDALIKQVAGLTASGGDAVIAKRAATEFPNVAANIATDLLKSAATAGEDTPAGKAVLKSLQVLNKGGSTLFKSLGSAEGGDESGPGDLAKAQTTYNTKVEEIAKRDNSGRADAMSKVRVEFPDLFKAAHPDREEVEA